MLFGLRVDLMKKKIPIRKKKKGAPSAKEMPSYAEWSEMISKGKCTCCHKRKAKAPFIWCQKCAKGE